MAGPTQVNQSYNIILPGYDASGHQICVALRLTNVATDATVTPNVVYGDLAVNATPSGTGTQNVNIQLSGTPVKDSGISVDGITTGIETGAVWLYDSAGAYNRWRDAPAFGDGVNFALGAVVGYMYNGTNHDRMRGNTTRGLRIFDSNDGISTTAVAASTAANTVIKASSGCLARVLITATGTNQMNIYDNATTNTGTVIGAVPASPSIGQIFEFKMPAANGITVGGNANNPGFTISWT